MPKTLVVVACADKLPAATVMATKRERQVRMKVEPLCWGREGPACLGERGRGSENERFRGKRSVAYWKV